MTERKTAVNPAVYLSFGQSMEPPKKPLPWAAVTSSFSTQAITIPDLSQQAELLNALRSSCNSSETIDVHSAIASLSADLARCEGDIRELKDLYDKMVADCTVLRAYVEGCPPGQWCNDTISYWRRPGSSDPQASLAIGGGTDHRFDLLRTSLERAGTSSLHICVGAKDPTHSFLLGFHLLAQYAGQWQQAQFFLDPPPPFSVLSHARGNLPLLESLRIHGNWTDECDIFEIAPRLEAIAIIASGAAIAGPLKLPWAQLRTLDLSVPGADVPAALSLMGRCLRLTKFTLQNLSIPHEYDFTLIDPPEIDSDVQSLRICITTDTQHPPETYGKLLGKLLAKLTLRSVRALNFESDGIWPVPWPGSDYTPFSRRSSCRDNVRALTLLGVQVSSSDLLQCLSDLPLLEALTVADPGVDVFLGDETEVIVTDSLLRRLTWTDDSSCLIPYLQEFHCKSYLRFNDSIYTKFITSRLQSGRSSQGPFENSLAYYAKDWRPVLGQTLTELMGKKELVFTPYILELPVWLQ
ncbi:hypothetical protein FB451DRAFT_1176130 [Mycena latifolia]|nr:hypothetical protein FB451DRAFT_1176130 [Mycena latifolia]